MVEDDFYFGVFLLQVASERLGAIDAPMLASGTAEVDGKMRKVAFEKTLDMMIDESIDRLEKGQDLAIVLQIVDDGLIAAGERFIFVVLAGIMRRSAVEDISAAIPRLIDGQTALETKGCD